MYPVEFCKFGGVQQLAAASGTLSNIAFVGSVGVLMVGGVEWNDKKMGTWKGYFVNGTQMISGVESPNMGIGTMFGPSANKTYKASSMPNIGLGGAHHAGKGVVTVQAVSLEEHHDQVWKYSPTQVIQTKEWNALPKEVKDRVHEAIATSITDDLSKDRTRIANDIVAFAYTNKENYSETIPMLYTRMPIKFVIIDFDFTYAISFVMSISNQARHALIKNTSLSIHVVFTDHDSVDGRIMGGLLEWLEACESVNQQVRAKAFNGVRIPWAYSAEGEDMVAHIDAEIAVSHWDELGEMELEWVEIKEAMQRAPVEEVDRVSYGLSSY